MATPLPGLILAYQTKLVQFVDEYYCHFRYSHFLSNYSLVRDKDMYYKLNIDSVAPVTSQESD